MSFTIHLLSHLRHLREMMHFSGYCLWFVVASGALENVIFLYAENNVTLHWYVQENRTCCLMRKAAYISFWDLNFDSYKYTKSMVSVRDLYVLLSVCHKLSQGRCLMLSYRYLLSIYTVLLQYCCVYCIVDALRLQINICAYMLLSWRRFQD